MFETVRFDTQLFADSVEFCPIDGFQHLLACSSYQLEESTPPEEPDEDAAGDLASESQVSPAPPQQRKGRQYLLDCDAIVNDQVSCLPLVRQEVDTTGILDAKWCQQLLNGNIYLGSVKSSGELELKALSKSSDNEDADVASEAVGLQPVTTQSLCESGFGLSLDWNCALTTQDPQIVTSDSTGGVHLFSVTNSTIEKVKHWHAHDFEAWITAFDYWDTNVVYTGGDDCRLKGWDTRSSSETPIFTDSRTHSMGVCSIQCNHKREYIYAVGSYDEHVSIHDRRSPRRPLSTTSLAPGGVWRVRWSPSTASHILLAAMHGGAHVLDMTDLAQPKLSCSHTEHTLAYGADWFKGTVPSSDVPCSTNSVSGHFVTTCSFYDHSMHIWQCT